MGQCNFFYIGHFNKLMALDPSTALRALFNFLPFITTLLLHYPFRCAASVWGRVGHGEADFGHFSYVSLCQGGRWPQGCRGESIGVGHSRYTLGVTGSLSRSGRLLASSRLRSLTLVRRHGWHRALPLPPGQRSCRHLLHHRLHLHPFPSFQKFTFFRINTLKRTPKVSSSRFLY